jgi:hypothetical protein
MTIQQQLEAINETDTQTHPAIKSMCLALAGKIMNNDALTQDDQRDYGAYKTLVDGYIQQVTYLEQIASNQQVN